MAVHMGGKAPYASTDSILKVIAKHRAVGLKSVDLSLLQRIGITQSLAPRTLQSLVLLDFYDDSGQVTEGFDALRKLGDDEYKPKLTELLQVAYADILTVLNPQEATAQEVENAFRGFEPTGQLGRMVQLFMGLFTFVGVMPERKAQRAPRKQGSPRSDRVSRQRVESPPAATAVERTDLDADLAPPSVPVRPDGHSRTVQLRTGGTMTLFVDVNPLSLKAAERDFFYRVVDLLDEYEVTLNPLASESSAQHVSTTEGSS